MIASLKKWFGLVLRQVGLDAKALRTMNQGLKWTGVALIAGVAIAAALSFFSESSPKLSSNSPASTAVSEKSDASAQRKITSVVTAKAVFGWVTLLSIALVGFIEPSEPKRDGRFKTGFKNNATVRKKTVGEIQTQRLALAVAAASAAFWYFL